MGAKAQAATDVCEPDRRFANVGGNQTIIWAPKADAGAIANTGAVYIFEVVH